MRIRTALAALAFAGAAFAPAVAGAQATLLGYLDPDVIIVRMPEYAAAQQQLQTRQQEIAAELQVQEDSIRTSVDAYRALGNSSVVSPATRQTREQEIMRMQQAYEQHQNAGLQELSRREAELLQPVLERLQEAIDTESGEMGLTMVFAARANNAPVLLFAGDSAVNLTEPVMERLGITMDTPASAPMPAGASGSGN
ncbi:MAG TPA: OmpH family outer membrane protein [Rhodothermales bacterium]|nr:OmpH family outer membrane protein [Rhodothermales bacterium]